MSEPVARGICWLLATFGWVGQTRAAETIDPHARMVGTLSCSSASCHGRTEPVARAGNLRRQEYLTWFNNDPHARAAATLTSDRFQQILARVSRRIDGQADPAMYARCAQCHDPLGIEQDADNSLPIGQRAGAMVSTTSTQRGIGCESCHGAAEHWLTRHYERGVSKPQLAGLGMVDTGNLLVRGRMCAACHIGSGDKDMNHDMIAAGHPPLRFELSSYHDLLGAKHWDDTRERLETPEFQVQLWAAGQLASSEAALSLLEKRASDERAAWPELAEYNCFACHQRLRPIDARLASGSAGASHSRLRKLGIPAWGDWNLVHTEELMGITRGDVKSQATPLVSLRHLLGQSFAPDRTRVAAAAHKACSLIRDHADERFAFSSEELLELLLRPVTGEVSWEASCQKYVALVAAERSFRDELAKMHYSGRMSSAEYSRLLSEQRLLENDFHTLRTWLQFERMDVQAKGYVSDEPVAFYAHRADVGERLHALATAMQVRVAELRGRE